MSILLFGYKKCSEPSIKRLIELRNSFRRKEKMYEQKALRAKKYENIENWRNKMIMYHKLWRRCNNLIFEIRDISLDIRYEIERLCELSAYNARLRAKEEKKKIFLTKYRYSLWFFSNSFHADYGRFICSKCGAEFYHSPARIYLAKKVVYDCCCGHCTNELIERDWNERPYS